MINLSVRGPGAARALAFFGASCLVAACGGGDAARTAKVTSISADSPPSYDIPATFSVVGTDLDAGVEVSAIGCAQATVLGGATATALKVSCTPSRDGEISLSLNVPGGGLLKNATFTVPKPQVKLTTSVGSLLIELEPAKAPVTVKNFINYVNDGFYVNTVFHRIVSNFVAQAGGFTFGTGYAAKPPSRSAIALEKTTVTGLSNVAKTVAMARTSAPDSATSQFFINLVDNLFLNAQAQPDGNGYAVFGAVITTAEVDSDTTLAALKTVAVVSNGAGETSQPLSPPAITAVTRLR